MEKRCFYCEKTISNMDLYLETASCDDCNTEIHENVDNI